MVARIRVPDNGASHTDIHQWYYSTGRPYFFFLDYHQSVVRNQTIPSTPYYTRAQCQVPSTDLNTIFSWSYTVPRLRHTLTCPLLPHRIVLHHVVIPLLSNIFYFQFSCSELRRNSPAAIGYTYHGAEITGTRDFTLTVYIRGRYSKD